MAQNDKNINKNPDSDGYSDFANVEAMRNYLTPEQLPEGPYGAPRNKYKPVENKSTPWKEGQRYYSAFNYEFKSLHEDMPRHDTPAHPTHDHPDMEKKPSQEQQNQK
ncbi:cytosolic protein [Pontibacillus yanchengensis]|uniref:Cytosolic protein n=1 Tax=Pontibacillus yanchengensis TaxID=462910 RepID=A0ACC7VL35_9BACI|nr:cytosolic protein [Pontibacillus yanchengensis]MYL55365.1 cytosolic protein [Pontibacillus yanchengensis]